MHWPFWFWKLEKESQSKQVFVDLLHFRQPSVQVSVWEERRRSKRVIKKGCLICIMEGD